MRQKLFLLGAAICLSSLMTQSTEAVVVYRDVGDLTVQAEQIIVGDVAQVNSFWNDTHDLILSRIEVRVTDYLLGQGSGTEVFTMAGGTVDDTTLHVSVLPVFEEGDHVLLFLNSNEIRLVESYQGAYLTDGESIARMSPSCDRVNGDSLQSIESFIAEIEKALPAGQSLNDMTPYQGNFEIPMGGLRYGLCGYDWTYKTNPMGENCYINPNSSDAASGTQADQIQQIQNGFDAWNNSGADFAFTYGGTSSQTSVSYNGTNLIYFDTTPPSGGQYVAANFHWVSGGNMTESDIVFNDRDYTWWNGSGGCQGMDIWNIATHELGHTLCLADLYGGGDALKTMYGYTNNCETRKRDLHSDDINGIIAIYGASGAYCGDGVCNGDEDCEACPEDCGICGDVCDTAEWITDGSTFYSNIGATTGGPSESGDCSAIEHDVWFKFFATCDGIATVSLCTSNFDTVMAIYQGDCPSAPGELIACDDDACGVGAGSEVSFEVEENYIYIIRIGGYNGAEGVGNIVLSCEAQSNCPGDLTGDDQVNIDDIFAVLGLWGDCDDPCPPYCDGDLTEDCTVNIDDIFAILGEWGPC